MHKYKVKRANGKCRDSKMTEYVVRNAWFQRNCTLHFKIKRELNT